MQLVKSRAHILPIFICKVAAGFPSPADDYIQKRISLDELILKNPTASFIVQAQGDSMIDAGIFDKSFLVVDKSLKPRHDDIVVVSINGDQTVKRLKLLPNRKILLCPENPKFATIEIDEDLDNIIWGVVTCVLNMQRL